MDGFWRSVAACCLDADFVGADVGTPGGGYVEADYACADVWDGDSVSTDVGVAVGFEGLTEGLGIGAGEVGVACGVVWYGEKGWVREQSD